MADSRQCASCGSVFPAGAGEGDFCPACVLEWASAPTEPWTPGTGSGVVGKGTTGTEVSPGNEGEYDSGDREDRFSEEEGDRVGPYELRKKIGEGGFGTVWMAEQTDPISRQVALKVIKAGMDTREVIRRFEAERRVLSLMDHPYIASVLDAGATGAGRPFFVMELVRGYPLTRYCDDRRLGIRERLELFIPVCQALQHAHQKAVLHRDLKPSNILVEEIDGRPVPRVIDFGIAKALGSDGETGGTIGFTVEGMIIGTPQYMSPEQAGSEPDLDTRSDIYSLGTVLFELLTGRPSANLEILRNGRTDEILRHIREDEAPRASGLFADGSEQSLRAAEARGSDPARLSRELRGDLDWILGKALEKDRSRRYDSASDLAADIERHLRNEPVEAGPPSVAYRLGKLVRRNRLAVGAAAVITLLLVVGIGVSTWQAVRAMEAEALALSEQQRAEEAEDLALARLREVEEQKRRADRSSEDAMAQRDSALRARKALEDSERAARKAEENAKEITTVTAGWLNNLLVKVDGPDRVATLSEIRKDLPALYHALLPEGELDLRFAELKAEWDGGAFDQDEVRAFDDEARYAEALTLDPVEKEKISLYRMWVRIWKAEESFRTRNFRVMLEELEELEKLDLSAPRGTRADGVGEILRRRDALRDRLQTKIAAVEASSVLPSQGANHYVPENLIDGKPETAWVPDRDDEVRRAVISFENPSLLRAIDIIPGYGKSDKSFFENGSVKEVGFEFSDGSSRSFQLERRNELQACELENPVVTEWVKVRIRSIYPGSRAGWARDVPVSTIEFR